MSAQPDSDTVETRVENALIAELNKVEAIAALKPDHWDADRTYLLPILKVKSIIGQELIPHYQVYAFRSEIELRSKPTKEDGINGTWLAIRRVIEDWALPDNMTDENLYIGAPAEEITTTSQVSGDERVRTLRFLLRGYSKI